MTFYKKLIFIFIFNVALIITSFGQQSLTPAIERLFNKIESDILTTAEAMPEEKFNFTPESLDIKNSNFKGVRTFAGQILHLVTVSYGFYFTVFG